MNNKIADLRNRYRITQAELAKAVGVTRQTIISLERGKYVASLELAAKISFFFHKTIEEVFDVSETLELVEPLPYVIEDDIDG